MNRTYRDQSISEVVIEFYIVHTTNIGIRSILPLPCSHRLITDICIAAAIFQERLCIVWYFSLFMHDPHTFRTTADKVIDRHFDKVDRVQVLILYRRVRLYSYSRYSSRRDMRKKRYSREELQ
jgi:hypothetical protein